MDILQGRRILLLEEHEAVGLLLSGIIEGAGGSVVGPVHGISDAMELVMTVELDAAILDVSIKGDRTFAVAEALVRKAIPFAFASRSRPLGDIQQFAAPLIVKPCAASHMLDVLRRLIAVAGEADVG